MERAKDVTDVWRTVFEFVGDVRAIVRAWLAFHLLIPRDHPVWREIFDKILANQRATKTSVLNRLRCFQDYPPDMFELFARLHQAKRCSRSGCYHPFREIDNHSTACHYHSGQLKGRLTCCGARSFAVPGCQTGFHDGHLYMVIFSKRPTDSEAQSEPAQIPSSVPKLPPI